MGEEASADEKSPEMTPQDDGTKVPLTEDGPVVSVEEAKYVSNPNGDAKIDIGAAPTFSGLTKEELMKYNNDPFWVRLRWSLFALFWLGWLAMIIMAVVIIIQAPGCKPPPSISWMQETPMVELNPSNLPSEQDLLSRCNAMDISSVYFPNLISTLNFQEMNYDGKQLIDAIVKSGKKVVTDLPSSIDPNNTFYANASSENLIKSDNTWDYSNEDLPQAIFKEIVEWWIMEGVQGFLMQEIDTPEKQKFKDELNELAKEKEGAVSGNIINTDQEFNTPYAFKSFLEEHSGNWSFYRFNPNHVANSSINEENMRLVTMGLFLIPGTPILFNYETVDNSTSDLIKHLTGMKNLNGIKFGSTNFVNSSDDDVAYTRVYKGTPAYAVALNFNGSNETVSFKDTANVGDVGNVEIHSKISSNYYETREKYQLADVLLGPYEGIVLQFVAKF